MNRNLGFVVFLAAVAILLVSQGKASTPAGSVNLNDVLSGYPQDTIDRLNSIYAELISRGYSTMQVLFMLSQICFETGILTGSGNYHLMNLNNYAGLTVPSGAYATYNSISDFVDAYDSFLTKGSDPLGASSLTDFNNRLIANHYYTADPNVYLNGLTTYYNLFNNQ